MKYLIIRRLLIFFVAVVLGLLFSLAVYAVMSPPEMERHILRQSVVSIRDEMYNCRGTAWILEISGDRVLMTAKHILDDRIIAMENCTAEKERFMFNIRGIEVSGFNGEVCHTSIISYSDELDFDSCPWEDWVILSCPSEFDGLPALCLSDETPLFGETMYWCGFGDTSGGAVGTEVIMSDHLGENGEMFRVGAVFGPGASGSPIYDPDRGVVGMVTRVYTASNYGIVIDLVFMADDIEEEYEADLAINF